MNTFQGSRQKRKSLDFSRLFRVGGRNRTRTCDPIDVNDVLYQLSHATLLNHAVSYEGTSRYYQLSQSTKDLCEPILAFCPPRHIHGALRIGSSVMYISQYVLPTEPCDQSAFLRQDFLSDGSYYSITMCACQPFCTNFSHLCFRPGRWKKA